MPQYAPVVQLALLDGHDGFRIEGLRQSDQFGFSVSSAGDVNGDGISDIIVGAPNAHTGGGSAPGYAYLIFGATGAWPADFDLNSLDGSNGFALQGLTNSDSAGYSVASAGDVNGDGF